MEQGSAAPAMSAANRTRVRALWRAGLCALSFQTAVAAASADTLSREASGVPEIARLSLSATASLETLPAHLYFVPASAARTVSPRRISMMPTATPRTKPVAGASAMTIRSVPKPVVAKPTPVEIASVETSAIETSARSQARTIDRKPTFLFGTRGKTVTLTPVSNRWQRALGDLQTETTGSDRHSFRAYAAILDQVKDTRRGLQIPKINYMVNRVLAYRDDARVWNTGEYWASPVEALTKRAGDCEDYAILKYALLRDLGVKDADMRIVVLMDTAARQHHAVLSVRHDGKWLILDNRFSRVRFERDLPHYRPLYSVNASGQWSHGQDKRTPVRLASRLSALAK